MHKPYYKLRRIARAGDKAVDAADRYSSVNDKIEAATGISPVGVALAWIARGALVVWGFLVMRAWPVMAEYGPLGWSVGALIFALLASSILSAMAWVLAPGVRRFRIALKDERSAEGSNISSGHTDGHHSRPPPLPFTTSSSSSPAPILTKIETTEDPEAKHKLSIFVVRRILPACLAQEELQLAALHRICGKISSLEKLAKHGLNHWPDHDGYRRCRDELASIVADNATSISFARLMELVDIMSLAYPGYCSFIGWICRSAEIDFRADAELALLFKLWFEKNEPLEGEYRAFQGDRDFPKLYSLKPDRREGRAFVTIM